MTISQRALNGATWTVAALALTVGGLRLYQYTASQANSSSSSSATVDDWYKYAILGHRDGPTSAAVTIVEFADFQCPFCQRASDVLKSIREDFPHDVAIVFRHFPLPRHEFAVTAAIASECAAEAGRFSTFHDLLFLQFDSIGVKSWEEFGTDAGITDIHAFQTCIRDSTTLSIVNRDRQAAEELGVDGTPTFLINDLKVVGFPGREQLVEYVREALDARGQQREGPKTTGNVPGS